MDNNGDGYASLLWVYMIFPMLGAILAAIVFRIHIALDNKALL
jgi:glycerol uptake facilitator-like aquaporin